MLADLAVNDLQAFANVVSSVKEALGQ